MKIKANAAMLALGLKTGQRVDKNDLLDMLRGGFNEPSYSPSKSTAGGASFASTAQSLQLPKASKMQYANSVAESPRHSGDDALIREHKNNIPAVARVRTAARPSSGVRAPLASQLHYTNIYSGSCGKQQPASIRRRCRPGRQECAASIHATNGHDAISQRRRSCLQQCAG